MDDLKITSFKKIVNKILTEKSGGVKFIEIALEVSEKLGIYDEKLIETVIKNDMKHLGILEYAMEMGDKQRIKRFVYLKLKD